MRKLGKENVNRNIIINYWQKINLLQWRWRIRKFVLSHPKYVNQAYASVMIYQLFRITCKLEEFTDEDGSKVRFFSNRFCLELLHNLQKRLVACYAKGKSERQLNIRYRALSPSSSLLFIQQYNIRSLSPSFSQQTLSPPFTVYFNHAYINVKSLNLDSRCRKVVSDPIKAFSMMSMAVVFLSPIPTIPHLSHSATTIAFQIFCRS